MNLKEFKEKLLQNPEFAAFYAKPDLAYDISRMLIRARILKGMKQADLAKKIKTHQSSIARAERGKSLPSLTFLKKIADAYGTELVGLHFAFMKQQSGIVSMTSSTAPASHESIQKRLDAAINTSSFRNTYEASK